MPISKDEAVLACSHLIPGYMVGNRYDGRRFCSFIAAARHVINHLKRENWFTIEDDMIVAVRGAAHCGGKREGKLAVPFQVLDDIIDRLARERVQFTSADVRAGVPEEFRPRLKRAYTSNKNAITVALRKAHRNGKIVWTGTWVKHHDFDRARKVKLWKSLLR